MDYSSLYPLLEQAGLERWAAGLPQQIATTLQTQLHGSWGTWQSALQQIAPYQTDHWAATPVAVRFGGVGELDLESQKVLTAALQQLHPWRKGPFIVHDIALDSEWRSDLKWARIAPQLDLTGQAVLDVGCGNGYYGWQMLAAGARWVVGIDPTVLFVMQFFAVQQLLRVPPPFYVLPVGLEALPPQLKAFDTVFSMGVLYHRRSPLDHLLQLRGCLRAGGTLVLETLVLEGEQGQVLVPEKSYAKMPNVWFIPSIPTVVAWLKRCQFHSIQVLDITVTTPQEQRSTPWMRFESLVDFLDPNDSRYTVEGLPAPRRALLTAQA